MVEPPDDRCVEASAQIGGKKTGWNGWFAQRFERRVHDKVFCLLRHISHETIPGERCAGFDREEDHWPRRWAEACVDFTPGEKYAWLQAQGIRFFPVVQWAERGGSLASGHGNSVPRFHVTWGTGPGVLEPFLRRVQAGVQQGLVTFRFRHRVTGLTMRGGGVEGVEGDVLEASAVGRGVASSRVVIGSFTLRAQAVIVTAGGVGGNHELVRKNWPEHLGSPPTRLISGVPAHKVIRGTRAYLGDRLVRVARPHRLLDPATGPLIAVRLSILMRKTLGGIKTDLGARVLQADNQPLAGLYAAGEVAGFGGGGMHGYRALEGTFLGGCLFSGRIARREVARTVV